MARISKTGPNSSDEFLPAIPDTETAQELALAKIDNNALQKMREEFEKIKKLEKTRSIKKTLWLLHDLLDPDMLLAWANLNPDKIFSILAKMEMNERTVESTSGKPGQVLSIVNFFREATPRAEATPAAGLVQEGPVLSAEICDEQEGH